MPPVAHPSTGDFDLKRGHSPALGPVPGTPQSPDTRRRDDLSYKAFPPQKTRVRHPKKRLQIPRLVHGKP